MTDDNVVMINHESRTALVIKVGHKLTHLVPMGEGELVLRALTNDEMRANGFRILEGYPFKRAARLYLKHAGGLTPKTRKAIKEALNPKEAS